MISNYLSSFSKFSLRYNSIHPISCHGENQQKVAEIVETGGRRKIYLGIDEKLAHPAFCVCCIHFILLYMLYVFMYTL